MANLFLFLFLFKGKVILILDHYCLVIIHSSPSILVPGFYTDSLSSLLGHRYTLTLLVSTLHIALIQFVSPWPWVCGRCRELLFPNQDMLLSIFKRFLFLGGWWESSHSFSCKNLSILRKTSWSNLYTTQHPDKLT